jgi:hypothetical protein
MTRQEMFNKMVAHLREQKAFSVKLNPWRCRYRGSNGTKCAIGALIPDDKYDHTFEGYLVHNLMFDFEQSDTDFLRDAQKSLHDSLGLLPWDSNTFEVKAANFAETYDLEYAND